MFIIVCSKQFTPLSKVAYLDRNYAAESAANEISNNENHTAEIRKSLRKLLSEEKYYEVIELHNNNSENQYHINECIPLYKNDEGCVNTAVLMTEEKYEHKLTENYLLGQRVGLDDSSKFLSEECTKCFCNHKDEDALYLRKLSDQMKQLSDEKEQQRKEYIKIHDLK